jgi:hypothetical protein
MPQGKRREWRDADNTALIALWDAVGSVALIAIMLRRSRSSVQTQASRLGLPPRAEESDRHRRRWVDGDDEKLDGLLAELALPDGNIPIQKLAERMGRSVDAVVARIETRHGAESDVMDRLVAPAMPTLTAHGKVQRGNAEASHAHGAAAGGEDPAEAKTQTRSGKTKKCLKCRKHFWSAGNHNWVCVTCKRSDDWDYEY